MSSTEAIRPPNGNSQQPNADSSALALGSNLLTNGRFQKGTTGWLLPSPKEGEARAIADGERTRVVISDRRNSSVGLKIDVTDLLRKHGHGSYHYGVTAKAVEGTLPLKATLVIEDAKGIQQHPSPDTLIESNAFATAARTQSLAWSELKRATLKIESGYGAKHDFVVSEVFLKK